MQVILENGEINFNDCQVRQNENLKSAKTRGVKKLSKN